MTTVTTEVLNGSAAVRLSISTLAGIQSLVRVDANGTTDVRTLPGVIGTVPATVEDLRNYHTNPTTGANYNFTRCTLVGSVGSSFTQVSADGTGTTYLYQAATIPVVAGDQLATNVDVRNPNAFTIQAKLAWAFYDAAGVGVGAVVNGALATITAGSIWYSTGLKATAPAGATQARALLYYFTSTGGSPAAGTLLDWKYWAAYKGPNAWANADMFFHGAFADDDTYDYSWAGTGYASESIRKKQETPFIFTDYEPADGPLRYDVTNLAGVTTSVDVAGFALDGPWLFTPIIPGYSRRVLAVTGLSTAFGDLSSVLSGLLGREDPIVVMRPIGTRSGTMEIYAGSYAEALDVLSPLRQGTVMMLRQPEHDGMDMYFAAAGGTPEIVNLTTDAGRTVFGVRVPYVEVRRPEGPLAGALGWTFADLAGAGATFAAIKRTFATFADLRLNKRKP